MAKFYVLLISLAKQVCGIVVLLECKQLNINLSWV